MSVVTILVGDIGGTNSRLMCYEINSNDPRLFHPLTPGHEAPGTFVCGQKYMNQDYPSFLDVVQTFLKEAKLDNPPVTACIACAGPIKDNKVTFTNREDWIVDGDDLAANVGIKKVRLVNDFVGAGYGLLTLNDDEICVVQPGLGRRPGGVIACIGAGTGLGECFLTPDVSPHEDHAHVNYQCFSSEGGHGDFAARSPLEVELVEYLKKKFDQPNRISVERVVSGPGIASIFEFLCWKYPEQVDEEVWREFEAAGDLKGAVVAKHMQDQTLCAQAMSLFVSAYGAEAGVAALKWIPTGGLYLTGGLTPKNIDLIKDPEGPFLASYLDKGRLSGVCRDIPVYAVLVENMGLRGAAREAFRYLQDEAKRGTGGDPSSPFYVAPSKPPSLSRSLSAANLNTLHQSSSAPTPSSAVLSALTASDSAKFISSPAPQPVHVPAQTAPAPHFTSTSFSSRFPTSGPGISMPHPSAQTHGRFGLAHLLMLSSLVAGLAFGLGKISK